jgi:hypothetical protein
VPLGLNVEKGDSRGHVTTRSHPRRGYPRLGSGARRTIDYK